VLLAATSLGGILLPSTYARETASWRAQGIGQDWFDLLVVVPVIVTGAIGLRRGSRAARIVLGGALIYSAYSFVLYAFAVHFNALFLVYCAGLGSSVFSVAGLLVTAFCERAQEFAPTDATRLAGWLLGAVGAVFAVLWLSEIIPALVRGVPPASLAEGAFFTNPVHVLDLSLVLPLLIASGVSLARGQPFGYAVAPVMLVFNVIMPLAIVSMFGSMRLLRVPVDLTPAVPLAVIVVISMAALRAMLRNLRHEEQVGADERPPRAVAGR
jgi:hypothetical protein